MTTLEPIDQFADERGIIRTWLRGCDVLSVVSAAGTKRANHYHKTSGHLLLVTKGKLDYYERPVGSTQKPEHKIFVAGEQVWSGPMVEHQMVFQEACEFWFFSTGCRTQTEYEADLVRLPFDLSEQV